MEAEVAAGVVGDDAMEVEAVVTGAVAVPIEMGATSDDAT